mgnify:CR=1 FL=1
MISQCPIDWAQYSTNPEQKKNDSDCVHVGPRGRRLEANAVAGHIMPDLLTASGVVIKRGRNTVLNGFDFNLKGGEVVVLAGENGCGKSTVIEACAGLIDLEEGSIKTGKQIIRDSEGRHGRPDSPFGLCLQSDCVMGDELVKERIDDVAALCGKSFDSQSLLNQWDLGHRSQDRIASLSKGQRRKVAVLCGVLPSAIADDPTVILLDEPDAGLDEASVSRLSGLVRDIADGGHGILIASHNSEIIACADRVITFDDSIVETAPSDGVKWKINSEPVKKSNIGNRLDRRTLGSLSQNIIPGMLVIGALLALSDPTQFDSKMQIGAILAPALAAGLCGEPISARLTESRSGDWWRSMKTIPPNALLHVLVGCALLTTLACTLFGEPDYTLIAVGGGLGMITASVILVIHQATLRLQRPNALMIRLLTPALILPWAILVDRLA